MQSRTRNFFFGMHYNFATDSVFTALNNFNMQVFPTMDEFLYLAGPPFMLLDGTNLLLLD